MARRRRRAAPTVFDADFELSLEGGTVDAVLTATLLNANTTKSTNFTGAWTTHTQSGGSTLTHTKVTADFYARRNPVRIDGVVRATTGTRGWQIDLTGRNGNDSGWEVIRFSLDGAGQAELAGKNFILGLVGYFNAVDTPGAAGQATALDFIQVNAGYWSVLQHFNEIGSANAGNIHAHAQMTGGASDNGLDLPTQRDTLYSFYNRIVIDTSPKRAETWLINHTTGVLLGYSTAQSGASGVESFELKDYIAAYGGALKDSRIVAAYGARAVILEEFTISPAAWSGAAQSAQGEITLGWTGTTGCVYLVEVRVNGGSWTTLLAAHSTTSYIHTGLTDGSSYEYRVMVKAAEYASTVSAVSSAVTINDSTFLLDRAEAWDSGGAFPIPNGSAYPEWNNSVGSSNDMYVLFSKALGEGSGFAVASYKTSVAAFGQKQKTGAIYRTDNATLFGGPMVRIRADASAAEGYGAFVQYNSGLGHYTLRIYKVSDSGSAAVTTQMGADLHGAEITWANGDEIEIKAINTDVSEVTLTAYRNGTPVGTTRVDTSSPYVSGQPGIGVDGGSYLGAVRMREVSS